ncbi:hypothetical protein, partial [Desulfatitalea alkaliphila]
WRQNAQYPAPRPTRRRSFNAPNRRRHPSNLHSTGVYRTTQLIGFINVCPLRTERERGLRRYKYLRRAGKSHHPEPVSTDCESTAGGFAKIGIAAINDQGTARLDNH